MTKEEKGEIIYTLIFDTLQEYDLKGDNHIGEIADKATQAIMANFNIGKPKSAQTKYIASLF